MNLMRATIRIMGAMKTAALQDAVCARGQGTGETGVFVIDNARCDGLDAIRSIVSELDYRIEILDANRTNLNDLEILDSPIREMARFAFSSEKTYVFVLRGWTSSMAADPRIANFRRCMGSSGIAMILSHSPEDAPSGFISCDLSDL